VLWRDKFVAAVPGRINKSLGDAMFGASIGGRNADGTYYDGATTDGTFTNGEIVEESGQKFLRHHIYAGSEGMLILTPQLYREATHATIEYDVRFDPDFDWQWGGKLACGLVGVKPGYGLNAPTSGNTYREFSTRLMWHGNCTNGLGTGRPFPTKLPVIPAGESDIVTYVYALYPGTLGYPNNIGFNNYGWHTSLGAMSKGVWHTIKCETGLNTVGSNNGIFRTWIDGVLKFEATNWNYRSDSSVTIQAVLWDVHRGGGLPDWASPQDCWIDVRNVTVREL
jgi:hypothetical protein